LRKSSRSNIEVGSVHAGEHVEDERGARERSREQVYVGLSRARDKLVACGEPDVIRELADDPVLKRLGWHD
jgi:hypothetical protein